MRTVPLGKVAAIERRAVDPAALPPETIYLGLEHIERGGRIIGHDTVGGAEVASAKFRFGAEHVLYGKLRPYLGKISRPDFAGVCSTDILPIRPSADLDRSYLAHYLALPTMVDFAAARATGANLPRLSPTVLATFPVPLPPLAEQRRIAEILDRADTIRTKRRQVLTHLDSLTQAVFQEMFGGLQESRRLGAQLEFLTSGSRGWSKYYSDSGDLFLRIQNVAHGRLDLEDVAFVAAPDSAEAKRTAVKAGDVLVSITADLGRTAVVPQTLERAFINQHLAILRAPEIVPEFLSASIESPAGRRQLISRNRAAVKDGLNFADIRSLEIPVASQSQQHEFARLTNAISESRAIVMRASAVDDTLFTSLQCRAFKGEL
ncbi:restriction endonuclease subunit S [Humibacter ginsenosidimutans]|uniref:Type I restriction modification DNA specificity domain-containing protein n=1 Tax=Humibacter ginsenosidimutans TaxID=2599293 RepID=A0A5B8M6V9_9MICO|nr:restriction endonuclease subunit S [Humibacter ginsenosidimutans]QDZ15445.1 hypothetical protein FPZ11_12380 [Humibacter ginsenosidimutans]